MGFAGAFSSAEDNGTMERFRDEFESPAGSVWLNTAHQGRLPRSAAEALAEAVEWKLHPELLATSERFAQVPARLRRALATLLATEERDIVLTNGASYGLHLLANGLEFGPGDEVVVAANDFPSNVLPWLLLRDRGVHVRMVEPRDEVLTAAEVGAHLSSRTRLVCLSWVHSFSGRVTDLESIGSVCRDRDIWFVVNGSQAVGVRPIAVERLPIDALVTVGWKWLCGPYGTGACYLRPELRDAVRPTKLYWLNALSVEDLAAESLDLTSFAPPAVGGLDIFATANFFNYVPFCAAIELVLRFGVDAIAQHVDELVLRLLAGIDRSRYRLVSSEQARSSLVMLEPTTQPAGEVFERLRASGVHVAHRRGRIRVAPHLYNAPSEIDRLLALL